MEATADPETAAAEGHRAVAGARHAQVDGVLLHRLLADQMGHRAPKALSHPPTTRVRQAEAPTRSTSHKKKADEVKSLSFPSGTAWRAWRANAIHAIVSAAGRHDDSALEWVMKVETHEAVDLETPGDGWVTLDRKLAAALAKTSHGELGRQLNLTGNAALSRGQVARDRVLLALVFEYYSAGKNAIVMFDINHIQRITLKGDSLESLQSAWTMVMSELGTAPDPAILQYCYFRQLQNYKPLADDTAYYKRAWFAAADATDHSFEFLFKVANGYLRVKRDGSMQEQLSRGLNGASDKALPGNYLKGKRNTRDVRADRSRQAAGSPNPQGTTPGHTRKGKNRVNVFATPTRRESA